MLNLSQIFKIIVIAVTTVAEVFKTLVAWSKTV